MYLQIYNLLIHSQWICIIDLFGGVVSTVQFWLIHRSRVTGGTWRAEIWHCHSVTKGPDERSEMWQISLWQFWPKFGYCVCKQVNLASAVCRRCMLHLKLSQTMLKYPASVWHLTKSGPCHTLKSQVMKWKFCQPCHGVTWVTNQSKLYSIIMSNMIP